MPYISQDARPFADVNYAQTPGELNYKITCLLVDYLRKEGKSYQTINDIMGALEGAKQEFYRRVAGPYEDTKIKENGDVY